MAVIGDAMTLTRMNIYLEAEQKAALESISQQTGASLAWLIRQALDEYLRKRAKPKKRGGTQ